MADGVDIDLYADDIEEGFGQVNSQILASYYIFAFSVQLESG